MVSAHVAGRGGGWKAEWATAEVGGVIEVAE